MTNRKHPIFAKLECIFILTGLFTELELFTMGLLLSNTFQQFSY